MSKDSAFAPDAWNDDWNTQANKPQSEAAPLSRSERLAQHAETNRKLWQSA